MSNILIIYFSQKGMGSHVVENQRQSKGNTRIAAECIKAEVDGDIFRVVPIMHEGVGNSFYTDAKMLKKMHSQKPELREYLEDIDAYKYVFVCGPSWWGTYPMAIFSQLERLDFRGKKVMSLVTHDGSVVSGCEKDIRKYCKGAKFGRTIYVKGDEVYASMSRIAGWARNEVRER